MLTAEEITWFQNSASDPHTTVTDNAFAALTVDQQKDLTCCSMVRGVMNRADPTDSSAFGSLYYETVSVPATLVADVQAFVEATGDPVIYTGSDRIPRNTRWQFRRILDQISVWDISTGTWNVALNDAAVKAELTLLFHYFGLSGESGWERLFRCESGLKFQDDNSLSYPDPCIPTSGNGIVHPAAWDSTDKTNNSRFDTCSFFADVVEDYAFLSSSRVSVEQGNPEKLDQVGIAIRNLQGYDHQNVPPDQIFVDSASYRGTEREVELGLSFRQLAIRKAVEARAVITWP